jgi:hypothetical protein
MHAPEATFTPANAIPRPVIPAQPPRVSAVPGGLPSQRPAGQQFAAPPRSAAPAPSAGSRVIRGCLIAIGVVFTISLGVTLGWLALQYSTHAMAP